MRLLTYPFELVAPMVAISSILLLLLGPLLIPRFYLGFLLVYFTCFLYSQINHVFKFWITASLMKKKIRQWNMSQQRAIGSPSTPSTPNPSRDRYNNMVDDERLDEMEASLKEYEDSQLVHAFIVPNYAEPEGLLRDTIKRLANHRNAQTNYVIVLAMEASELGHEAKAESLAEYFKDSFLHFIVTVHPSDIPGESRGKGSNVSYATRVACSEIVRRGIDRRRVVLTISDSDSSIPELYVNELEKAFTQADDPHFLLYAPPIFFSRNCFDVPAAVRMTDITWSAMVMANLSNSRGISFPCSTYSISQVLAERVGFWDTDADSVGEDMHMMLKCFFKTDGLARCQPIFVPINLTNVQTNGYLSNMYARFVQASRHYNGVADVSYTLRNAFGFGRGDSVADSVMAVKKSSIYASPTFWIDKLIVCIKVLEAHMIPVTSGWLMFAAVPLMQFVMFPPHAMVAIIDPANNPILTSDFYATLWNIVKIITVFLPFPLFATLAIYENLHRVVDRELYRKVKVESRTWRNCFDYISLPIAAWMFMTIPSTIAALKRLYKTNDQYIVAEKFFQEDDRSD
ncbi:hypothetical protein LRAMOSA02259 [Lichtheimia ramosa]|uniref:Glycosyltransferase 2-like domain-containing protein n=1 Tax=Lichtheimia ramosa TaxID=688394 RepID=A0A077WKP6_9FUNG|nr:hypothetical protein LRAMOSA02259 [Lichtheimia ramosa]